MLPLIKLVLTILDLYKIIIIAGAILSWLIAFGVVNIRNDIVRAVWNLFLALTEPFLRPIRKSSKKRPALVNEGRSGIGVSRREARCRPG